MRRMGIAALGPKPRTGKRPPLHKIFPYLLRELAIGRPEHVSRRHSAIEYLSLMEFEMQT